MFKKITLIFCLIFLSFAGNSVFGDNVNNSFSNIGVTIDNNTTPSSSSSSSSSSSTSSSSSGNGGTAQRDTSQDITKETFTIDTDTFSVGGKNLKGITGKETINKTLGTFIRKLMIALGVISLLIMTIGAGYIILYHGEDEYLSKGKSIFKAGIIALVVSLSSYYIVNLIGYILYK